MSIDSRSSPPNIVKIISFRFLLSPPFSINLCDFRRSHDIDVVDRYSDFAISLTITTDVGEFEDVGNVNRTEDNVGDPMLENAIRDDAIPSVGIGDVTILLVKVVMPDVALAANDVATLDLLDTFSDSFEASAAVTLVEIIRSSCSGVFSISTTAFVSTLDEDASGEEDVAGNDPANGPLFRILWERIDDFFSIV